MVEHLGVKLLLPSDDDQGLVHWLLLARNLYRDSVLHVIGFVPAEKDVGVAPVALQLAVALQHLSASGVTIVDCNTSVPAWRAFVGSMTRVGGQLEYEFLPGLRVVTRESPTPRIDVPWISQTVAQARRLGAHVLCDLTGLEGKGALPHVWPLLDGVVSVVRAGATLEWRLSALHRQLPPGLDRGVVFVNARRGSRRRG